MHICLLAPDWPPERSTNGIVTYVAVLRTALCGIGHRVSVIAVAGEPDPTRAVTVLPLAKPSMLKRAMSQVVRRTSRAVAPEFPERIAAAVNALHARDRLDVLEMEESFGWCAQVQALVDVPVVVKLHGPAFMSEDDGVHSALSARAKTQAEGDALRSAIAIVAPTLTTLRDTATRYGLSTALLSHVFNPVDPAIDEEMRWQWSDAPSRDLVFVGRFDRRKGADRLIEAFKLIAAARPGVRLVFVGPDHGLPCRDGSVLPIDAYLQREVEPQVRRRIVFLGRQPKQEVMRLRSRAAAVLIASRRESYGYAVAEALVQGCPVVAFNVPGVNELIKSEDSGLLAPDGDIVAYAQQVIRVVDQRALAIGLGQRGRSAMQQDHSPDAVATAMVRVYDKALTAFSS